MELPIYILKSAGVLAVFYGVYYFFLRRDTLFTPKRHFLIAGIFAALGLPLLVFTRTIYVEPVTTELVTSATKIPVIGAVSQTEAVSIPWFEIFIALYGIGMLILLIRLSLQLWSLVQLIGRHPREKHGKFIFVKVDKQLAPFSFFNYIVYNPELHEEQELLMIIQHEKVHASQWHSFDILLGNFLQIIQWLNPIAWLYKRGLEENLEFIADSETVYNMDSKTAYQLALVKASSPLLVPGLTNNFYQSFIKKRIIMLNKRTSKKQNIWKIGIVIPLLAVFLLSFNVNEVVEFSEAETTKKLILEEELSYDENPTEVVSLKNEAKVSLKNKELSNNLIPSEYTDIKVLITKNTSGLELESLKTKLRSSRDIDLVYKDERNNNNEIMKLSFYFNKSGKEVGTLGLGLYDNVPVENSIFYFTNKDGFGFWNASKEKRLKSRLAEDKTRTKEFIDRMPVLPIKDIKIKITKTTTKAELDKIKADLKENHNIDFSYSNLNYNNGVITSISISYSSEGANGNYAIEDDEGIEDFYFYIDGETGESGFWSEGVEERRAERMLARAEKMNERMKKRSGIRVERDEIRKKIAEERKIRNEDRKIRQIEMDKRVEKMDERFEEFNEELDERRAKMDREIEVRKARIYKGRAERIKNKDIIIARAGGRGNKSSAVVVDRIGSGEGEDIIVYDLDETSRSVIITKNTTDAELDKIKSELAADNIDFNIKRVKRNNKGEITALRIQVDNNKGSKTTTAVDSDGEAIETVIIRF